MRFYENIPLPEGDKKILVVFLVLGAMWAIFLGPDILKEPTALAAWLLEALSDWGGSPSASMGFAESILGIFKGLIALALALLIGILWIVLWLFGLLKLHYLVFGALYGALYALLFIVMLRLFLKIMGVDSRFLAT